METACPLCLSPSALRGAPPNFLGEDASQKATQGDLSCGGRSFVTPQTRGAPCGTSPAVGAPLSCPQRPFVSFIKAPRGGYTPICVVPPTFWDALKKKVFKGLKKKKLFLAQPRPFPGVEDLTPSHALKALLNPGSVPLLGRETHCPQPKVALKRCLSKEMKCAWKLAPN